MKKKSSSNKHNAELQLKPPPSYISEELKGKTTDVQNWKKMSYDIFMEGKINLNSLVKTELRYSNF